MQNTHRSGGGLGARHAEENRPSSKRKMKFPDAKTYWRVGQEESESAGLPTKKFS